MIGIITICFFACISMISVRHGIGLWLFLMITHGIFYQFIGPGSEHLPLCGGLAVMTAILVRRRWACVSNRLLGLLVAIVVIMSLAGAFGINHQNSAIGILLFLKCIILAVVVAGTLQSVKDLKTINLYFLSGLATGGGFAIYQYLTGSFAINTIYIQRAASLRGDPNDTAMLLVAGVPIAFFWFFSCRNWLGKLAALFSLGILLAGIILTASRGGFVALSLVLFLSFVLRPSLRLFSVALISITLLAVLSPPDYWKRMNTMVTGKEKHSSQSLRNRARLQIIGLEILLNNPVIGVGPGNFGQAYRESVNSTNHIGGALYSSAVQSPTVAHNMYLEFFAENGIPGGVLFIMLLCLSIKKLLFFDRVVPISASRLELGFCLALSLGGMLFAALFLSQGKNSVLWFLIGIGFAAGEITRKFRHAIQEMAPSS